MDCADVTELIFPSAVITSQSPSVRRRAQKPLSVNLKCQPSGPFSIWSWIFAQGRLKAAVVVCCIVINIDFPFLAACMAAGTSLAMEIIETLGQDGNHGIHLECVGSFYYTSLPPFGGEKLFFL